MQIINKPIEVTDEEVDRALMAEFTASMSNEKATEGATNGMNKWFRIDTQVFID